MAATVVDFCMVVEDPNETTKAEFRELEKPRSSQQIPEIDYDITTIARMATPFYFLLLVWHTFCHFVVQRLAA